MLYTWGVYVTLITIWTFIAYIVTYAYFIIAIYCVLLLFYNYNTPKFIFNNVMNFTWIVKYHCWYVHLANKYLSLILKAPNARLFIWLQLFLRSRSAVEPLNTSPVIWFYSLFYHIYFIWTHKERIYKNWIIVPSCEIFNHMLNYMTSFIAQTQFGRKIFSNLFVYLIYSSNSILVGLIQCK